MLVHRQLTDQHNVVMIGILRASCFRRVSLVCFYAAVTHYVAVDIVSPFAFSNFVVVFLEIQTSLSMNYMRKSTRKINRLTILTGKILIRFFTM